MPAASIAWNRKTACFAVLILVAGVLAGALRYYGRERVVSNWHKIHSWTFRDIGSADNELGKLKYWPNVTAADENTFHNCESVGFPQSLVTNATFSARTQCNLGAFKKYYREHHDFPGAGYWCQNKTGGSSRLQFVPSMCQYAYSVIPSLPLTQCLAAKSIRKIVTMGDSQSGRHHAAMYGELVKGMDKCRIIKAEHKGRLEIKLDPTYLVRTNWTHYDKANVPRHLSDQGCKVCIGMLRRCTYTVNGDQHVLYLEHLRMSSQRSGSEYLRYLFTDYLKRHKEPDFVIIWPPVNHLKNGPAENFAQLVTYVTDLVMTNLGKTQLIWVPGAREVEVNKPEKYKNVLYTGSLSTGKIQQLNRVMYKTITKQFEDPRGRVHGFWDMVNIARDAWNTDGIHYLAIWYTRVQQQLLQTLCAP